MIHLPSRRLSAVKAAYLASETGRPETGAGRIASRLTGLRLGRPTRSSLRPPASRYACNKFATVQMREKVLLIVRFMVLLTGSLVRTKADMLKRTY